MIDRILEEILRRKPASSVSRIAWAAFLILFPFAYIAGSWLHQQHALGQARNVRVDRASAIALARQFLAEQGVDATSWNSYVSLDPSEKLLSYYAHQKSPEAARAASFAPPIRVRVLLTSAHEDTAHVDLDGMGRVVGYELTGVKSLAAAPAVDADAAAAVATAAIARAPHLAEMITLGQQPEVATVQPDNGVSCRKYTWHSTAKAAPGLNFEVESSVCGARALGEHVRATVDPAYARQYTSVMESGVKILLLVYGLYVTVVVLYSLYRYARRALDREISHKRTLLLAALIAASLMLGLVTALDEYVFGVASSGNRRMVWIPLLLVGITYVLGGLLFAIAYEAGEGDVREVAPSKMTSLDALLRGRIFSRNVARSIIFGTAFAAWALLLDSVLVPASAISAAATQALKVPFFRYPLLAIFMSQAVTVTLIPATALLLPLAFVSRHIRRPRIANALLILFGLLGCLLQASKHDGMAAAAFSVMIVTALLMGAFIAMDFLAAMSGLLAFAVAQSLVRMVSLSTGWQQIGTLVGVFMAIFIGLEVWAAFRGREYHDIEVRPLYASNIAERQQLQAEVAAAREAQLRLLPKAPPEIRGLSITAACIPARVVGGDFYDFFRLGEDRLGIFIAEGGNRGIGSALNIALAKGFLMHTVRRGLAPQDVILRLESALGTLISGVNATTYVAYAVVDSSSGRIWYARTGEYPKVLVGSKPVAERRVAVPGTDKFVYEGTAELRGGDAVLLVTDGIARKVRLNSARAADQVIDVIGRRHRANQLEDDLTAVVLRVERVGSAIGVVA